MSINPIRPMLAGEAVYPPGSTLGPRHYPCYEFVWIDQGHVVWVCNDQEVAAPPGTMLLVRAGVTDTFIWDPHHLSRHGYIEFEWSPSCPDLPPADTWPLTRRMHPGNLLHPLAMNVLWLISLKPEGWQASACQGVMHLLTAFVRGHDRIEPIESRELFPPQVLRCITWFTQEWSRTGRMPAPTIAQLTHIGGASRTHLHRVFLQSTGTPPLKLVRRLRLHAAASLLERTDRHIKEIAEMAGFETSDHFSREFRREHGLSPKHFRQRLHDSTWSPPLPKPSLRRLLSVIWGVQHGAAESRLRGW